MRILMTILLLFITINVLADNPPKTYQEFKFKFKNVQIEQCSIQPKISLKQRAIFGATMGATAFIVTEIFFYGGKFNAYHKSILIGGAVHLITHIFLQSTAYSDFWY